MHNVRTAGCTSANSRHPGGSLVGQSSPTGPGGLCPTQAVSGPHGAPRAASHRRPRDAREGETAPRGRPRPASCGQRPALRTCATRAGAQRDGREAAEKALAVTTRVQRRLRRAASDRLAASWAALRPQRQQERRPSPRSGRGTPAGCGKRGRVCQERSAGCEVSVAYDGSRSS